MSEVELKYTFTRIRYSALIAIAMIFTQGLISQGNFDRYEYAALAMFAIAIPILAGLIYATHTLKIYSNKEDHKAYLKIRYPGYIGETAVFWGILFTFAHISTIHSIIFFVSFFAATMLYYSAILYKSRGTPRNIKAGIMIFIMLLFAIYCGILLFASNLLSL